MEIVLAKLKLLGKTLSKSKRRVKSTTWQCTCTFPVVSYQSHLPQATAPHVSGVHTAELAEAPSSDTGSASNFIIYLEIICHMTQICEV